MVDVSIMVESHRIFLGFKRRPWSKNQSSRYACSMFYSQKNKQSCGDLSSREINVSDVSPMKLTISFFENYKMYFNLI